MTVFKYPMMKARGCNFTTKRKFCSAGSRSSCAWIFIFCLVNQLMPMSTMRRPTCVLSRMSSPLLPKKTEKKPKTGWANAAHQVAAAHFPLWPANWFIIWFLGGIFLFIIYLSQRLPLFEVLWRMADSQSAVAIVKKKKKIPEIVKFLLSCESCTCAHLLCIVWVGLLYCCAAFQPGHSSQRFMNQKPSFTRMYEDATGTRCLLIAL